MWCDTNKIFDCLMLLIYDYVRQHGMITWLSNKKFNTNFKTVKMTVRPQFFDTLFIIRLKSNMSMCHVVIINY